MVKKKIFTDKDIEIILTSYNAGSSQQAIASKFSVSTSVIKRVLLENNISIRGVESNGKVYTWDDDYFEVINTEHKAYWLGFLMADGYVTNGKVIGVKLSVKDIDHLHKLNSSLSSNIPIHVYTSNSSSYSGEDYKYCVLNITSRKMYNDLLDKGLTPNKSKTLKFPKLDDNLVNHFIRGYFDGDGSVYNSKSGVRFSMLGTEQLLSVVKPIIAPKSKSQLYRAKGIFYISLGGNNARMALTILYRNATVYLDRKYEKYKKLTIDNVQRL